jgi:ribonucleoside-diphosphate reductase beta chain
MQRYDTLKYKQFDKLTDKQLGFFWRPDEIDLNKDSKDFKDLTRHEQHIFTSNLKRQILLDSVQGRSPNLVYLPIVSLPEIETWIQTWAFSETIHSRSYTHIIRNIYSDPSRVFDEIMSISEIVDCANDITVNYDQLLEQIQWYNLLGTGQHTVNGRAITVDLREIKRLLWLSLMSVNVLEGLRFYVSFACSWAFAEVKRMEGNAKIIKLICRDENVHLASTQALLKLLPKDDPEFEAIRIETEAECIQLFQAAAEQEKQWARFLFKDGSMIGLNETLLCDYVDWICAKRMSSVGLKCDWKVPSANPLPWTNKWIAGSEVQVAPQETEISQYIIGAVKQDIDDNSFRGFSL